MSTHSQTPFEQARALAVVGARVTLHEGWGYHYGYDFGRLGRDESGMVVAVRGSNIYIKFDSGSLMDAKVRGNHCEFALMAVL